MGSYADMCRDMCCGQDLRSTIVADCSTIVASRSTILADRSTIVADRSTVVADRRLCGRYEPWYQSQDLLRSKSYVRLSELLHSLPSDTPIVSYHN